MYAPLWIIEWQQRGRYDEAIQVASTPDEAAETIKQMLEGEIAFDETTDEERPAFDVLLDGGDAADVLRTLDERLELECESGTLIVRRTVQFKEDEPKPCAVVTRAETRGEEITAEMIRQVKDDFLEWSGGFPPDSPETAFIYVHAHGHADLSDTELTEILMNWMRIDPYNN